MIYCTSADSCFSENTRQENGGQRDEKTENARDEKPGPGVENAGPENRLQHQHVRGSNAVGLRLRENAKFFDNDIDAIILNTKNKRRSYD